MTMDAQPIEILNLNIWAVLRVFVDDWAKFAILNCFAYLSRHSIWWSLKPSCLLKVWVKGILLKGSALFFLYFWLVLLWMFYICCVPLKPKELLSLQIRHQLSSSCSIFTCSIRWRLQKHHGIRGLSHLCHLRNRIDTAAATDLLNSWSPRILVFTTLPHLCSALSLRLQTRWLNGTHTNMV